MSSQMIIMVLVAYLTVGFLAAQAATAMVSQGVIWKYSTLWQKVQRWILFPNVTLVHYRRPHVFIQKLQLSKPTFDDLWILKKHPWLYCLLLWPLTVIMFISFLLTLAVGQVFEWIKGKTK